MLEQWKRNKVYLKSTTSPSAGILAHVMTNRFFKEVVPRTVHDLVYELAHRHLRASNMKFTYQINQVQRLRQPWARSSTQIRPSFSHPFIGRHTPTRPRLLPVLSRAPTCVEGRTSSHDFPRLPVLRNAQLCVHAPDVAHDWRSSMNLRNLIFFLSDSHLSKRRVTWAPERFGGFVQI